VPARGIHHVDLAVAEEREETIDLFVVDRAPQADAVNIVDWNENGRLVRDHPEMVEAAGGAEDGFGFDALNDAESVIWVNDLVTNLKCHMSPSNKVSRLGVRPTCSSISIAQSPEPGNEKPS